MKSKVKKVKYKCKYAPMDDIEEKLNALEKQSKEACSKLSELSEFARDIWLSACDLSVEAEGVNIEGTTRMDAVRRNINEFQDGMFWVFRALSEVYIAYHHPHPYKDPFDIFSKGSIL